MFLPVIAAFEVAEAAEPVLTKPPALVQFVEASFPESEVGHTGSVVLAITIRVDGTVEDATVTQSASPDFDAAAVAAALQFVFSPAEVDGSPSRIRILYKYDFIEKVAVPTTAIFAGVVSDREAHVPLPGVTVALADGRTTVTDDAGRFEFLDVAPGALVVTLEGPRLTPLSTEETFIAGEKLEATYEVFLTAEGEEGDDLEILVQAPTIKRQAVSTEIAADDARKVPGTQGDVLRVVENLPGVARASLGTGALVVWGASPEDTGVYIDGVRVPRLYHDGGLRSIVGSDFVKSVELVPGGYGAAYGRGLGGLVSVKTNRFEDDDGPRGSVTADLYDASASIHGPVSERVNLGIAGRYGYVGPLLGAFVPDVEDFFPLPHYWDVQGRLGVTLRPNESIDLTVLASSDATARTAPNPDPARDASEVKSLAFQRAYVRYARDLGDGSTVSAVAFVGQDKRSDVTRFGPVETAIGAKSMLAGARGAYRSRVLPTLTLEGGLDAELSPVDVVRTGSIAAPAREGDVRAFGQPLPDQIASDAFSVVNLSVGPYAEADWAPIEERLHVVVGLRADPLARSVSRAAPKVGAGPTNGLFVQDFHVEPRLAVRFAPTETSYVTVAAGSYAQAPQVADLSAAFGNPALPTSTAQHLVFGFGVRPAETLSIDVTAFHTTTDGLAVRNPADQPARAEAVVATGQGRSTGAQIMARLDPTKGFYGWLSYTLAKAERRADDAADWRLSDYDQRHVLTALGGFAFESGFEVGLRARVATGSPRTEVIGAYYDDRRDLYQPQFGAHNATHLPTFFQLDVRAAKSFNIGDTVLETYVEIQNVTNQANVEEFVYDADYGARGAIHGLPLLPVIGVRWAR